MLNRWKRYSMKVSKIKELQPITQQRGMIISSNGKVKSKSKNGGFTLVEVIVSIIILAIIILPLLQNFVVATKTNGKARKEQYALSLAQSVMEGAKGFTIEEAALQFFGDKSDFYFVNTSSLVGALSYNQVDYNDRTKALQINNTDACVVEVGSPATKKFIANNQGKYSFVINNVKEGTGLYDVVITYDASNYTGKDYGSYKIEQNDFKIPKVEALDANKLALIDPFAVFRSYDATGNAVLVDDTYDERVKEYYHQVHLNYITTQWNAECAAIAASNSAALKAWQDAGSSGPAPTMQAYPDMKPTKEKEDIAKKIERTTEITVKSEIGKKRVNCKLIYTINATDTTIFPRGTPNREYEIYHGGMEFLSLEAIYLFYPPFTTDFDKENVVIKDLDNTWSNPPNIFIAIQEDIIPASAKLSVDVEPDHPTLNVYSQMALGGEFIGNKKSLVLKNDAQNRIYDVTVEVYDSGGDYTNLRSEISSSVRE